MRTTSEIKDALSNSEEFISDNAIPRIAEEALDVINYLEDEYFQLKRRFDRLLSDFHTHRSQNDINKHIINAPGDGAI